jgi:hypothetical protein
MDRQAHWDDVFKTKGERVSWHESLPAWSLELMEHAGLTAEMNRPGFVRGRIV